MNNPEWDKELKNAHWLKSEMYYNSWKWQDWIAEALIALDNDFKSKKISYQERQERKQKYEEAMKSVN